MKNLQKGFAIPIIIAVIALLAVGGGVYIYNSNQVIETGLPPIDFDESNYREVSTTTDNINLENRINIEEVIWKTYQNQYLKFSLQLPEGFVVIQEDIIYPNKTVLLEFNKKWLLIRLIELGKYGSSLEDWRFNFADKFLKTKLEINGKIALKYLVPAYGEGGENFPDKTIVIMENNGYVYHFEFFDVKELSKEHIKILSSIQFNK